MDMTERSMDSQVFTCIVYTIIITAQKKNIFQHTCKGIFFHTKLELPFCYYGPNFIWSECVKQKQTHFTFREISYTKTTLDVSGFFFKTSCINSTKYKNKESEKLIRINAPAMKELVSYACGWIARLYSSKKI